MADRLGVALNSDEDYLKVLLREGLTTVQEATQLSGRGAGLSAIQTFAQEWGGVVRLMDNQPRGSRIVVTIPEESSLAGTSLLIKKDPMSA